MPLCLPSGAPHTPRINNNAYRRGRDMVSCPQLRDDTQKQLKKRQNSFPRRGSDMKLYCTFFFWRLQLLLFLRIPTGFFCMCLSLKRTIWMWFRWHGKHWERMKSYGVQIVLKTLASLSVPCGVTQCHAKMLWWKKSLNGGHDPLRYDSRRAQKFSTVSFIADPQRGGSLFRSRPQDWQPPVVLGTRENELGMNRDGSRGTILYKRCYYCNKSVFVITKLYRILTYYYIILSVTVPHAKILTFSVDQIVKAIWTLKILKSLVHETLFNTV